MRGFAVSRPSLLPMLLFLIIISAPYMLAAGLSGPDAVFGGFLLNPQDGNTYLAKMYQGWLGEWRFKLPYSREPGEGVFLFGFYLWLGHVARWTGLSLIWVFHLARLTAAVLLAWMLWNFFNRTAPIRWIGWCFMVSLLGLGMGWLAFAAGVLTSDFWVAEAYPFLSAYANPHFPLSLAIMLGLLTLPEPGHARKPIAALLHAAGGAILSLLSPFGAVLTVGILGTTLIIELVRNHGLRLSGAFSPRVWVEETGETELFRRMVAVGLGALPLSVHYVRTVRSHPQLSVWDAQNLTLTPAVWDVVLALAPAIILAGIGLAAAGRVRQERISLLIAWVLVAFLFMYMPIGLQRRFMMGLYVPMVALAAWGLEWASRRSSKTTQRVAALALGLALPTTALVLALGVIGAAVQAPALYLSRGEAKALDWIEANTPPDVLILASPEMGIFIPAHTGRRVIYGHPYETGNAAHEKAAVEAFFQSAAPQAAELLTSYGVNYVFYGPREKELGDLPADLSLNKVFGEDNVLLLRVVGR